MNIFAVDSDPVIAAKNLCDKHIVKMATESLQILSCAAIRHGVPEHLLPLTKSGKPVRGGYKHHPSSVWAGQNKENYLWLCLHGQSLCEEYTERYGKKHFCEQGINILYSLADYIPDGTLSDFAVAISPDSLCRKVNGFNDLHPVKKYRLYYKHDKAEISTWKQNKPAWVTLTDKEIIND